MRTLPILISCLLFSCSSQLLKNWDEVKCKGKIFQGSYYDEGQLFAIGLPQESLDVEIIEKQSDGQYSNILFSHWLGFLHVMVTKMPIDPAENLTPTMLKDLFDKTIKLEYLKISSESQMLYEEPVDGMYFAVYNIPEEGQSYNLGTGKRDPAIRASLLFQEGDLLALLTTDEHLLLSQMYKNNPEKSFSELKAKLIKSRQTFRKIN